jgi:zona occludens toxin (predicted ATPase)
MNQSTPFNTNTLGLDNTTKQVEKYWTNNKTGIIIVIIIIVIICLWYWWKKNPNFFCNTTPKVNPEQVDRMVADFGSKVKQLQRKCDCDTECRINRSNSINSNQNANQKVPLNNQSRINNNVLQL